MIGTIKRKLRPEDYREPTKADFIGSQYRVIFKDWRDVLNVDNRPSYPNKDVWAVERLSRKYGWVVVTAQILPYYYEPIYFLDRGKAFEYKTLLEDPNSIHFDGMVNYVGQHPSRFNLEFFPKD